MTRTDILTSSFTAEPCKDHSPERQRETATTTPRRSTSSGLTSQLPFSTADSSLDSTTSKMSQMTFSLNPSAARLDADSGLISDTLASPDLQAKPAVRRAPPGNLSTHPCEYVLCRHFIRLGSCRLGDQCKFAHGEEELEYWNLNGVTRPRAPVTATLQPVRPLPDTSGLLHKPETFVLCRHYVRGFCRVGNECRFGHGVEELNHWHALSGLPPLTPEQVEEQVKINMDHDANKNVEYENEQSRNSSAASPRSRDSRDTVTQLEEQLVSSKSFDDNLEPPSPSVSNITQEEDNTVPPQLQSRTSYSPSVPSPVASPPHPLASMPTYSPYVTHQQPTAVAAPPVQVVTDASGNSHVVYPYPYPYTYATTAYVPSSYQMSASPFQSLALPPSSPNAVPYPVQQQQYYQIQQIQHQPHVIQQQHVQSYCSCAAVPYPHVHQSQPQVHMQSYPMGYPYSYPSMTVHGHVMQEYPVVVLNSWVAEVPVQPPMPASFSRQNTWPRAASGKQAKKSKSKRRGLGKRNTLGVASGEDDTLESGSADLAVDDASSEAVVASADEKDSWANEPQQ